MICTSRSAETGSGIALQAGDKRSSAVHIARRARARRDGLEVAHLQSPSGRLCGSESRHVIVKFSTVVPGTVPVTACSGLSGRYRTCTGTRRVGAVQGPGHKFDFSKYMYTYPDRHLFSGHGAGLVCVPVCVLPSSAVIIWTVLRTQSHDE